MKTILPYFFKKIGISLFILSFAVTLLKAIDESVFYASNIEVSPENVSEQINEKEFFIFSAVQHKHIQKLIFFLALFGLLIYSFSKEKVDDEFLVKLRGNALLKSFIISWIIMGIAMLIKGKTESSLVGFLQLQMLIYVGVYAYTKKVKYAE